MIERVVTQHGGSWEATWSWDPKLPLVVWLRAGDTRGVLSREALEELVAQVDCGVEPVELRVGRVELLAVPCFRSLQISYCPGLPKRVIVDLHETSDFLAETCATVAPCAGCDSPACGECVAMSVWADGASLWCLSTGRTT